MKKIALIFASSLLFLLAGCQESTRTNTGSNSNNFCMYNPGHPQCYNGGTATGGGTTGVPFCQQYPSAPQCQTGGTTDPYLCFYQPYLPQCQTGTTTGGTSGGVITPPGCIQNGINRCPNYYSGYVDKNWQVHYPYIPSISCSEAVSPSGIDYTPYDTRKGSITLKGQVDYDPSSGQAFFDTTSSLLQSVQGAKNFFWGDSILKLRFKANLQPESRNTTSVCPGRATGQSTLKGYGKIRFDLYLVGLDLNGRATTEILGNKEVKVNSCSPALDLSSYAERYPGGIYLKVKNVQGNQNWMPGTNAQQQVYDTYGYVTPQNPSVEGTWTKIRNAECWSLDIEVAADGTKTFN